jgi:8-oxo-dGTP pyrophosphatase MutT (NUDIX family)
MLFFCDPPNELIESYAAAGVIVLSRNSDSKIDKILLGKEDRSLKRDAKVSWLHFGGRKEDCDNRDPRLTALRELNEETLNVLDQKTLKQQILENTCPVFYLNRGRYFLYILFYDYDLTVVSKFNERLNNADKNLCQQLELQWFDINCLDTNQEIGNFFREILNNGVRNFIKCLNC